MKAIYEYDTRVIVKFSDDNKASYSVKRYGELLKAVVEQSYNQDEKYGTHIK